MVPLELSAKVTAKGYNPLVGLAAKAATGACAPMPVTALVLLPPLLVLTTTALLKLAALPGVKLITRFMEPKPGRVNGVPETTTNGPVLTEAVPLVSALPPRLVITKLL